MGPGLLPILPLDMHTSSRTISEQAGYDLKGRYFEREVKEVHGYRLEVINGSPCWVEYDATIEEITRNGRTTISFLRNVVVGTKCMSKSSSANSDEGDTSMTSRISDNVNHSSDEENCDYGQDVGPRARKPGHSLGVLSFEDGSKSYYLVATEGWPRDAINFRGIATEFKQEGTETEILNFHIRGPLLEMFADLPLQFDTLKLKLKVCGDDPKAIHEVETTVLAEFPPFLSADGMSPHGAILRLEGLKARRPITLTLADFSEGFTIIDVLGVAVIVVAIAVGAALVITAIKGGKGSAEVEADFQKKKVKVKGDFETAPGVAPATSGSK